MSDISQRQSVVTIQNATIILKHVATVSDIAQVGMLFVFTISASGHTMTFRFKEIDEARAARKSFVAALEAYWQSQ